MAFETRNHFSFFTLVPTIEILWASARPLLIDLFSTFFMCEVEVFGFFLAANLASVVSNEDGSNPVHSKHFSLMYSHNGPTCLFHNTGLYNVSNLCVKCIARKMYYLTSVLKAQVKMYLIFLLNDIYIHSSKIKVKLCTNIRQTHTTTINLYDELMNY
jgi:hypothetical protein